MSDTKCHPSLGQDNQIEMAATQPQAVCQIALLPGGQVGVQFQGPLTHFILEGMLGAARKLLLDKIDQASKGGQIVPAPPGLRLH